MESVLSMREGGEAKYWPRCLMQGEAGMRRCQILVQ